MPRIGFGNVLVLFVQCVITRRKQAFGPKCIAAVDSFVLSLFFCGGSIITSRVRLSRLAAWPMPVTEMLSLFYFYYRRVILGRLAHAGEQSVGE